MPTKKQNPDDWGRCRIYGADTGAPGPRDPHLTPYAIPFGRDLLSTTSQLAILVTAAQSGKTETFLDIIGERLDNRPVPILYVGPSKEFNTDQFEPRLRDLFLQAKSLLAKVIGGLDGKRQKKTLKRVAGVTLRLGTAGSPTSLKSSPAGMALVDEYDDMLRNLRDQGDVLGLIMARGETYVDFVAGVTSTPSQGLVDAVLDEASGLIFWAIAEDDDVSSPIWRLWQRGTRYHWCWPCPHCRAFFVPRRDRLRYPEGATPAQAKRDSWLECPRCEGKIFEHHKAGLNARGAYVAPGQQISRDGVITGTPADTYPSRWVSGLCSPFKTFGDRAERYLAALATNEPAKVQTAINAAFGEVAIQATGDTPDHDAIAAKRIGHAEGTIPPGVVVLLAAVDVQKHRLIVAVRGFGANGTSWLVCRRELWGPTAQTAVWNELSVLLTSPIDGQLIKMAFVDSGFRPGEKTWLPVNRVYEFCRRHRRFVFATKGTRPRIKPLVESTIEVVPEDGSAKKFGLRLLLLDADHWKATVHERLGLAADMPGCLHLNADVDEDYCRQLVAETRVVGASGKPTWVKRQKDNHYLDIEAMLQAAAFKVNAEYFGAAAAARAAERRAEKKSIATQLQSDPAPAASETRPQPHGPAKRSIGSWARRFNR